MIISKRAQSRQTIWWLINLFFVAIILLALALVLSKKSVSQSLEKKYFSKDVGLVINALYASPNNIVYAYTDNKFDFSADFSENTVTIYTDTPDELVAKKFNFIEDENIEFVYKTINNVQIEDATGQEKILLPLGFKKQKKRLEPFSVARTSDIINED